MSATRASALFRRSRLIYALIGLCALALIVAALAVQQFDHVEPCPLCILQRYAFTGVAAFALLAAALRGWASVANGALALLCALAGAGVAAWHVHLQLFPPEEASCGPSLQYLLSNLPLGRALPRIFQGYGDCTSVDWTFLKLSLPAWALVWLLGLSVLLVLTLRRQR